MEKLPFFVINGGVKMPVGFRFHPTDEELVIHYLKRKVHASPLPASIIPELDVFQTHPWCLPGCGGDVREKRYFFYNQTMNGNMDVNEIDNKLKLGKRAVGCGYWKPTGKEKQILTSESNEAVGIRKTLVFCQRKRPNYHHHGTKTRWLMHEFRLLSSQTNPTGQASKTETGNWVVYCVFQKRRKPQRSDIRVVSQPPSNSCKRTRTTNCVDVTVEYISAASAGRLGPLTPSSSSCSSDITHELSSFANGIDIDDDQEENNSSYSCLKEL